MLLCDRFEVLYVCSIRTYKRIIINNSELIVNRMLLFHL